MFREFVAEKQRRVDEHDRDVAMAWRMAMFERQSKLPRLETVLGRRGTKQTPAEQRGILRVLSEQYGIPLRQTPRRTH